MRILFTFLLAVFFLISPAGHAQEKKEIKPELQLWGRDTIQTGVPYFKRRFPEKKGQVRLTLGFPWINHFYVHPPEKSAGTYFGFGGLSVGGEYAYKSNRYLRAEASFAFTWSEFVVFGADVYNQYLVTTATFALSDNIQFNRWTLGAGVQWSHNGWSQNFPIPLDSSTYKLPSVYRNDNTVGAIGTVHYQLGKAFLAGIIYRPNFVRLSREPGFLYQHSISLDLSMKFGLRNKL